MPYHGGAGRVRVVVRDARTKDLVPKVLVKVIGSNNPSFFSGQTDLRGVFVAEGVNGQVTAVARKDAGFKAWMTQLTDSADLDGLAKWAAGQGLKTVPVGAFEDADGPPAYTLSPHADVTVLLFVKQKVVANFAFRPGELTDQKVAEVARTVPTLFEKK